MDKFHYYKNVYLNLDENSIPFLGLHNHDTRDEAILVGRSCSVRSKFLYTIKVIPKEKEVD